ADARIRRNGEVSASSEIGSGRRRRRRLRSQRAASAGHRLHHLSAAIHGPRPQWRHVIISVNVFNRLCEDPIREATAEGGFANLRRGGERLDLEEYFSAPEDLRMAYSILKSANCRPAEVELLNEIARLKEALETAVDAAVRQSLGQTLASRQTELAIRLEQRSRYQP